MVNDATELWLASLELPKLEACVELMLWAAYSDGRVDPEERALFEAHVQEATKGQLGPELIRVVVRGVEEVVRSTRREARVPVLARTLAEPKVQRGALALAVTVAMADGVLTDDERAFLEETAAVMGLPKDDVGALLAAAGE